MAGRSFFAYVVLVCLSACFWLSGILPDTAATEMNLSITEVYEGKITYLRHPYEVDQYDIMPITVGLRNIGSMAFDGLMELRIYNFTIGELDSYYNRFSTLYPGEERAFYITHLTNDSGYQWIYVNISFEDEIERAWGGFYVNPYVEPPEVPAEEEEEGAAGAPEDEVGIARMGLNYTESMNVTKGESYLIYIMVKNIGSRYGNVSFDNVRFFADSIGIPFTFSPESILRIEPGRSGFFIITLNVPRDIDEGEYVLDFTVRSDETEKNGSIMINVREVSLRDEVWGIFENYRFIIERLEWEIRQAALDGANVSKASSALEAAESYLEQAKGLFDQLDYDGARSKLVDTKDMLIKAVRELALAKEMLFRILLPAYLTWMIIIIIIIIVLTFLLLVFVKRRKREREEKLKEKSGT